MRFIYIIVISSLLTGCFGFLGIPVPTKKTEVTVTENRDIYPAVGESWVKVLHKEKPPCTYEKLGFIKTALAWNRNAAIRIARSEAAKLGSDYVVIEKTYENTFNDARVDAIAYKCQKTIN